MLVRFTSKAGPDIVMFEADAALMLRLMNHSGTIPSAILAEDIAEALKHLEDAVLRESDAEASNRDAANDDEAEETVDFATRAYSLIELLKAAHSRGEAVMWDYDGGAFV